MKRGSKWSRGEKIVCNLALIMVSLFVLAWSLGFPAWTQDRLLHRAEREFLLEGSELLYTEEEGGLFSRGTLYARNGEALLTAEYARTPLGLRLERAPLLGPSLQADGQTGMRPAPLSDKGEGPRTRQDRGDHAGPGGRYAVAG